MAGDPFSPEAQAYYNAIGAQQNNIAGVDLNQDPAYMAYVRALDQQRAVAMQGAAYKSDWANILAERDIPRIQEREVENQRNIGNTFEARGVFRSGERLRKQALSQTQAQQRIEDVNLGRTQKIGGYNLNLQSQLSDLARQQAERGYQATSDIKGQNLQRELALRQIAAQRDMAKL